MAVGLALGGLVALAAFAEPAPRTAAVVEVRSVPLLGVDGARKAVGRAVEAAGWRTIALPAGGCATDDCFKEAAARTGVERIFFVDVAPVPGAKFRYEVGIRGLQVPQDLERRYSRTCEPCLLRRDFDAAIGPLVEKVGGEIDGALAQALAASVPPVVAEIASPPSDPSLVAKPAPQPPERRSLVGPLLLGAGALSVGAGAYLLHLDGRATDCDPACAGSYRTHGGLGFVIGGAVAMAAGVWLWAPWARSAASVSVAIGPAGATIAGAF